MSSGRVTVVADGVAVAVRPGETLFDALMRGGFPCPYACRRGRCAACKVQLISGEVVYIRSVPRQLFSDEERAAGICLSCTALPVSDVHVGLCQARRRSRDLRPAAVAQPAMAVSITAAE